MQPNPLSQVTPASRPAPLPGLPVQRQARLEALLSHVAAFYNLPATAIASPCRDAMIVRARWMFWRLARDAGFTTTHCAAIVGHTHSTLTHATRRLAERVALESDLAFELSALRATIPSDPAFTS